MIWRPITANGTVLDMILHEGLENAPLVILIHSLGCDKRVWDGIVPALRQRATVVAYDLRGHGLSGVTATVTLKTHAADVLAVMDNLGAQRAVLVGLSIGGQIAMQTALTDPDRIAGLVLMDTAARIGSAERYDARAAAVTEGGIAAISDQQIDRWFPAWYRDTSPEKVAAMRAMLERQPVDGYLASVRAIAATDLGDRPSAITCPTLLLCGSEDVSTTPAQMQSLAALIEGADLSVIDGVGHLPPIEAPDATADQLLRFLDRIG